MAADLRGLERARVAQAGETAVDVAGLTRRYGDRVVLDRVDLRIRRGEFVALLGRSGSGKTTLLKALAALDDQTGGQGRLRVPANISVVFQDSRLLPWQRVLGNVTLGLRGDRAARGRQADRRGRDALAEVGLSGRERAWPNQLSGGEQQRVALARSLVREPELLLADEPFGALDALTRARMHRLLHRLCAAHEPAVLLVTHDVDEAIILADRVIVLDRGVIIAQVPIDLPGTRGPGDPGFADIRRHLLTSLGMDTHHD